MPTPDVCFSAGSRNSRVRFSCPKTATDRIGTQVFRLRAGLRHRSIVKPETDRLSHQMPSSPVCLRSFLQTSAARWSARVLVPECWSPGHVRRSPVEFQVFDDVSTVQVMKQP